MRSTWCRLLFAVLFASLLPRCIVFPAKTREVPLEELEGPGMEVRLVLSGQGRLRLTYDALKGENDCLKYTGGKARLNGVELEQTEEGFGLIIGGPLGTGQVCTDPEWAFSQPPATEEVSELEITDSTGQLLYGVSALTAKRSMAVRGLPPWPVPGGPLTFDWSPATDQLTVFDVRMSQPAFSEVAVRNGRLGFLVSPDVEPGPQPVFVGVDALPGTAHCEPDPDRCKMLILPDELMPDTTSFVVYVQ